MTAQLATGPLDLDALGAALDGTLHLPGTARYEALARPWNVAVVNRPVAVVEAATAEDVAAAVRHAAANGLHVSVQATGHGAVAHAHPTLQVSTTALRELNVDPSGTVRAGAGLTWRDVIDAAAPLGFAGLAGSAPGVGVVGFLTGGGIGPVARTYGVSSDYVAAFDVVTGTGELRRATATENPALFWALRGGKGAFGIVTAVEFDLVPLTEIFGGCLYFDGADAATVLHAWAAWTPRPRPARRPRGISVMGLSNGGRQELPPPQDGGSFDRPVAEACEGPEQPDPDVEQIDVGVGGADRVGVGM